MFIRSLIFSLLAVTPALAEIPTITVDCSKATEPCSSGPVYVTGGLLALNLPAGAVAHGQWCIVAVADDCLMIYDIDNKTMIQTVPNRVEVNLGAIGKPALKPEQNPPIGTQLPGSGLH